MGRMFLGLLNCFYRYNEILVLKYSLPHLSIEHGFHTPSRTKNVYGLWEAVIVDQPSVDGEQAHHEDDVTALEECVPDLHVYSYTSFIPIATHKH